MTELAALKRLSSATLRMELSPCGKSVENEMFVEAPYEFVVSFVADEMGHDLRIVDQWIARVKRAMAGEPFELGPGNAWGLAASEETATLTNEYIEPPRNVRTLPTSMLLEVLAPLVRRPSGKSGAP